MTEPSSSATANQTAAHAALPERGFGTFSGVFTPSILTILGVIMYLRFGWVVGAAGLGQALLVIVVAHLITLSTGLSVSSIATNRTVRTGGAYYIISRSLGAPTGAAIGIPLFLAQAISVTFYVVGLTETIGYLVPELLDAELLKEGVTRLSGMGQLTAAGICLFIGLLTFKGAEIAIKTQYIVMAAIILSLISFFTGGGETKPETVTWWNPEGPGFGAVFAVFFPAVTGIMAGVGMSGDLKDPRKSLPRGTLLAIAVGFAVYMIMPFWLATQATPDQLINDKEIIRKISRVGWLFYAGVWGATFSSAIGSFLTAPRTLQALAYDRLAPQAFAKGFGPNSEPRIGVFFTFVLAELGILIGGLDAIAALLTMFFLATYGFTNLACALERWAASPSFRPDFKVHWLVSLTGGVACIYVMAYTNFAAMIAAFVICGAIWLLVQRRNLEATWGDARHGIWSALVRTALYRLRRAEFHPQNWRPNLLILGGGIKKHLHLLELGSSIVQDRGLVTYMHLLKGKVSERVQERSELLVSIDEQISQRFPHVFCRVDITRDVYQGVVDVAQSYGMGSFEANTVMLGWPKKPERREAYTSMLRDLVRLDRSLLLVRYDARRRLGGAKKIQIWWGGLQQNGGFMLLLAFLMTAHHRWRNAVVEVITVINEPHQRDKAHASVANVIEAARVRATPRIILREGRGIREIMKEESEQADLAIVGMRLPPANQDANLFFERMDGMLEVLPTTMLVHSAQHFQGEPLLFDAPAPAKENGRNDKDATASASNGEAVVADRPAAEPPSPADSTAGGQIPEPVDGPALSAAGTPTPIIDEKPSVAPEMVTPIDEVEREIAEQSGVIPMPDLSEPYEVQSDDEGITITPPMIQSRSESLHRPPSEIQTAPHPILERQLAEEAKKPKTAVPPPIAPPAPASGSIETPPPKEKLEITLTPIRPGDSSGD